MSASFDFQWRSLCNRWFSIIVYFFHVLFEVNFWTTRWLSMSIVSSCNQSSDQTQRSQQTKMATKLRESHGLQAVKIRRLFYGTRLIPRLWYGSNCHSHIPTAAVVSTTKFMVTVITCLLISVVINHQCHDRCRTLSQRSMPTTKLLIQIWPRHVLRITSCHFKYLIQWSGHLLTFPVKGWDGPLSHCTRQEIGSCTINSMKYLPCQTPPITITIQLLNLIYFFYDNHYITVNRKDTKWDPIEDSRSLYAGTAECRTE